jgi:hypothetical protein
MYFLKFFRATAPLTEFSADRTMPDLKAISQAPHPVGSAAQTAVREYLWKYLRSIYSSVRVGAQLIKTYLLDRPIAVFAPQLLQKLYT